MLLETPVFKLRFGQGLKMEGSRRLISLALFAAAISFPPAAQAEFCGIAGQSAQEIAVNVAKTREFKRVGGNVRYVAYSNKAAMVTLTVTTPANRAHPAVACRHAFQKNGDWVVSTEARCAASESACKAMMREFRELDAQMKQALEMAKSKP